MAKGRLEAFSDGVLAIVITIMVLEMRAPEGTDLHALGPVFPVFLSYILSFVYVGIHWNNHHHLLAACSRLDAGIMWANLHLLFWLSLIPFVTRWMGGNDFAPVPTALYGVVLLMAALAYWLLQGRILAAHPGAASLRTAIGRDLKGKLSPALYALAIVSAFLVSPWISCAIYAAVALMWVVPDRRIERALKSGEPQ